MLLLCLENISIIWIWKFKSKRISLFLWIINTVAKKPGKARFSFQSLQQLVSPEREELCDNFNCVLDIDACFACILIECSGSATNAQALLDSLLCESNASFLDEFFSSPFGSMFSGSILIVGICFLFWQIFVVWLDVVTYLHHHGYEQKLPWYRGKVLIIILYHVVLICFRAFLWDQKLVISSTKIECILV